MRRRCLCHSKGAEKVNILKCADATLEQCAVHAGVAQVWLFKIQYLSADFRLLLFTAA